MKTLKSWLIVTMIFALIFAAGMILTLFEVERVAIAVINVYEDITGKFGNTIESAYHTMSIVCSIGFGVMFITNQILAFCYGKKGKKLAAATAEEKEKIKAERAAAKAQRKKEREELKKKVNEIANTVTETGKTVSETNNKLADIFKQFK